MAGGWDGDVGDDVDDGVDAPHAAMIVVPISTARSTARSGDMAFISSEASKRLKGKMRAPMNPPQLAAKGVSRRRPVTIGACR